jgi:hypothetical protein
LQRGVDPHATAGHKHSSSRPADNERVVAAEAGGDPLGHSQSGDGMIAAEQPTRVRGDDPRAVAIGGGVPTESSGGDALSVDH